MRSPLTPPQSRQNLHRAGESDSWRAQSLVQTKTQETGAVTPRETDPDLAMRSRCLQQSHGSAVSCCRAGRHWVEQCMRGTFWRSPLSSLPPLKFGPRETTGREHSPTHQQKIGLKIYWAWPLPSEQNPVSPSVSLSHQEASISLLSLSIRGQTDWKPQSQKTNQSERSLI